MKSLRIFLFLALISSKGFANISFDNAQRDSTPLVKVILMDRTIIAGQLQYATGDSIYILPGTNRDARRGRFYKQAVIAYCDVISIRLRDPSLICFTAIGLAGLVGLYLVITGVIPVFNNGLGYANIYIYISPFLFIGALLEMLKRKRHVINGSKNRYEKFRVKLKK